MYMEPPADPATPPRSRPPRAHTFCCSWLFSDRTDAQAAELYLLRKSPPTSPRPPSTAIYTYIYIYIYICIYVYIQNNNTK